MIDVKARARRYASWKRNVASASTFVVICGFVAALYFFYRLVLIAAPIVAIEQSVFNPPSTAQIVCQDQDEEGKLQDPQPLLSLAYQNRIRQQKPITSNGVSNADLSQVDSYTGDPVGYSHSIDDDSASYQYLTEKSDDTKFLRVTNTKQRSNGQLSPAWEMDPVAISPDMKTYAYSFWYRSTVPVHVSTEYTADTRTRYGDVMTLDATDTWKQFTAHFDNNDKATTFRVDINSTGVGQVDTKGLDVHKIANAKLNKGIVTVTFDDGWESIKTKALPLLEKYGIRSTEFIITEVAAHKVPGYMTYGEIAKLKAAGQEIGSHSLTHCNQTELSPSLLEDNAVKSKQALEQQKLGPIKTFAYPLGEYNKKTQAVYEKQYPLIRTSIAGYNDRYYDETNIHSMAIANDTSDAAFETWLSYAETHRLWLVLVYHRVDETGQYSMTSQQFEQQLKMIQKSGLGIMTMSEAAAAARK
ncbi:MAG: putative xylanase/chitin deacetylase [Candidatus Saccharibacteria bacterium]|nr:putative xylanase/chitin deacetylase [Candidatus Saccharibacteria bacterium]